MQLSFLIRQLVRIPALIVRIEVESHLITSLGGQYACRALCAAEHPRSVGTSFAAFSLLVVAIRHADGAGWNGAPYTCFDSTVASDDVDGYRMEFR